MGYLLAAAPTQPENTLQMNHESFPKKVKSSTFASLAPGLLRCRLAVAFAAGILAVGVRASDSTAKNLPEAREDVKELRQVTSDSINAIRTALRSLDHAGNETPCPPRVLRKFTRDVQQLEVDSFKMRERAQAMRARGQAYFEQWHQHLASLHNPQARKVAVERHDLLQQSFDKIRASAQQTREAFQPFMAGLHKLRSSLENDPGAAGTEAMKNLIRTTRESGQKAEAGLADIQGELKTVADILKERTLKQ
jgi:hypothetical protein